MRLVSVRRFVWLSIWRRMGWEFHTEAGGDGEDGA